MTTDSELLNLYSGQILALAADIPHTDRLAQPDGTAKRRSPLCGSTVTVDLTLDAAGRISGYGQDVKACALGQAAASVIGRAILGQTRQDIATGRAQLAAMLKENGPEPTAPFDGLRVLAPAKDFKNRHASILLAFDACLDAFDAVQPT